METAAAQEKARPMGAEARANLVQKELQSAWIAAVKESQTRPVLVRRGGVQFPVIIDAVKALKGSPEILGSARKAFLELEFVEALKSASARQLIEDQIAEIAAMKHYIQELFNELNTLAESAAKSESKDPNTVKRMREIYNTLPTAETAFLSLAKTQEKKWLDTKNHLQTNLASVTKYTPNFDVVKQFLSDEIKEMYRGMVWYYRTIISPGPEMIKDVRLQMEQVAKDSGVDLYPSKPKPAPEPKIIQDAQPQMEQVSKNSGVTPDSKPASDPKIIQDDKPQMEQVAKDSGVDLLASDTKPASDPKIIQDAKPQMEQVATDSSADQHASDPKPVPDPKIIQDAQPRMEQVAKNSGVDLHASDPKPARVKELSPEKVKTRWMSPRVLIVSGIAILSLTTITAILVFAFSKLKAERNTEDPSS
jgi:hypothetical protein